MATSSQELRTLYSIWDFQQSLSALTFLLEECNYQNKCTKVELRKFRCYESTAIISFCRPFAQAKGQTTLSLKNIKISLNQSEKDLQEKLLSLRHKIIAHSDEEFMHFKSYAHKIQNFEALFPHIEFEEALQLSESEHRDLEELLRKLIRTLAQYYYEITQSSHELTNTHKKPTVVSKNKRDP